MVYVDYRDAAQTNTRKGSRIADFVKSYTDGELLRIFLLMTCLKVLLIPTYYSTDFEVHRNWLAITHSLPIEEWYTNSTSQWTLDYPPLFAWFEYCLSQIAVFFDSEMLKVKNLNYASPATVVFQRTTVMVADFMFVSGVHQLGRVFYTSNNARFIFNVLTLTNVGLLLVDHVHFQYNGFLLGFLLLSIAKLLQVEKQVSLLQGAFWFCILLNLKHIYLYVAPVYVVWLLKYYCIGQMIKYKPYRIRSSSEIVKRLLVLGAIVLFSLVISFGPFVMQLPQLIARLFPFKRGLVHAYWAANSWALYVSADKILSIIGKQMGWLTHPQSAVMTGGLVQEQSFSVLPTPTPLVTFIITLLSMLPSLWILYTKKEKTIKSPDLLRCMVLCALSAFLFGWHVHEKAILTAIITLCALATMDMFDARIFIILSSAGHTALLPLLFPSNLIPLKLLSSMLYMFLSVFTLSEQFKCQLLYLHEFMYIGMLPVITIYETIVHKIIFQDILPFLPLAITSVYCAIGIVYSWLLYYYTFLNRHAGNVKQTNKKINE